MPQDGKDWKSLLYSINSPHKESFKLNEMSKILFYGIPVFYVSDESDFRLNHRNLGYLSEAFCSLIKAEWESDYINFIQKSDIYSQHYIITKNQFNLTNWLTINF